MGADEEGTHERLKAHRRELVDPKIGEHSGRIVKTTGDGMLAEFPSVVDAVRCAAELQRAMKAGSFVCVDDSDRDDNQPPAPKYLNDGAIITQSSRSTAAIATAADDVIAATRKVSVR